MNEAVKTSVGQDRKPAERQADRFIARWLGDDRTCIPASPGALVMVPYPGLRSFKPELNQFFFGRERQKAELKAFFAGRARESGEARRQITFVVGGSGSGKSSLTLAGLIAELNTIDMATTAGAWYVAQMRPAQDPIAQLLTSLTNVVARIVDVAVADTATDRAAGQLSKIAAALDCPDAKDPSSLKDRLHDKLSERLAPLDKATGRRSLAIAALFQFVDETLDRLDEVESHAQRSGKPLLLIHIDQFEEVFREQTDADGRQALMQLLRKVHEYAPARLFVVATMRSEELHKCSEFEGIADVINSSMYLIDLVSNDEIERAIVEPARRQTTLWELPINSSQTAPYTAEAVRWLQRAYQTAGTAALHTADQLPLLQHFLPLLWEEAVNDWLHCREKDPAARFEITKDHIEKVPGWIESEKSGKEAAPAVALENQNQKSHLGRCLNAHADTVLDRAIEKWGGVEASLVPDHSADGKAADCPKVGFGDPSPERAVLIVAFCCLAQRDDRGRPARRFATLEDIVAASGLSEWKMPKYDHAALKKGLERELFEFEKAGLIERIGSEEPFRYNVNHEAFIRNWNSYEGWLKEKQFVQQRLREIDSSMGPLHDQGRESVVDLILASRKRDAYAIIPDETGERLRSVFGDKPIFSQAWAAMALSERPDAESAGAPASSFSTIEKVWADARWWKQNGWMRKALLLGMGFLCIAAVVAYAYFAYIKELDAQRNKMIAEQTATLNRQLYNSIISLRTNLSGFGGAVQYREMYASLLTAYEDNANLHLADEPLRILRATLYQIDNGIRQMLGNEISLRFPTSLPSGAARAICGMTSKEPMELVGYGPGHVELGFVQADGYWAPLDGSQRYRGVEQGTLTPNGFALPDNTLICLSSDARWLMFWIDRTQSPVLTRVVWSKLDNKWQTKLLVQRQIMSTVDSTKLTSPKAQSSYDYLTNKATSAQALKAVMSFNDNGSAGFLLPTKEDVAPAAALSPIAPPERSKLMIWSTTGLIDPDDSNESASINWNACDYKDVPARVGTGSRTLKECGFPVAVPDLGTLKLVINYAEGEDCLRAASSCQSTIELRYPTKSVPSLVDDEVGVRIIHNFARVSHASLQDGWLWLKDENGKIWRYIVAKDRIKFLVEQKWRGVSWSYGDKTGFENFRPSDFCRQFPACRRYLSSDEGRWPVPPKELLGDLR